jgi:hypothetical protein
MTAASCRAIAALFVFAGAQHLVPAVGGMRHDAFAQSSPPKSPGPQSRKETIHNPLNDYLDEA